jgi:UDP-3-O-[3-hydroxymyristoyl] glucosamine N-acyltransferase
MIMQKTVTEIARLVGGKIYGDASKVITGFNGINEAGPGDLTFLSNPKYLPSLKNTKAGAVLVSPDISSEDVTLIYVDNPSLAFAKIMSECVGKVKPSFSGVHPTAVFGKGVKLGDNVTLGPYTVIEDEVAIGDNTIVYGGCYIGRATSIGKDCLIYANVTLRESLSIGDRVAIHSGTVIGSDGFGYENVGGKHVKIPQAGTVVIEDDVEIGANVTIDRARFDKTFIGKGTKIDNLVQIAHNVIIGENSIIIAQVGISGSTEVGKGAILAGQAGVAGHLTIGEFAVVAAQAGVTKSVPPKTMVSGYPAKPHSDAQKVNACLQRLPHYVDTIRKLQARIEELEKKLQ